jgi:hypothetical protein
VETNPLRFALEIYPADPRPITVEVNWEAKCVVDTSEFRFAVDTKFARLAVEIWEAKFAVDTKLTRFAVETNPPIAGKVERYPALPKPITVEVSCEAK